MSVKSSALKVGRSGVTAAAPAAAVDAANPWLGLASFSEETRAYFHGRDEDAAELARRVQRKLLTVLFGQSGHGKTSLLRAGLVPRLRNEGYCPVYVRLDYAPESPPPSEQIKAAIFEATQAAGSWTKSGSSVAGESLWEFLHHRDDKLTDAAGKPLIPLLIFDQFEEIFTLAQSDATGRQRAQSFLTELADLVENRPPVELEGQIDREEADASRFDFARADYRILISLREDYLAHLEALKGPMPSVTQNRVRLARFSGAQALAAVRAPAPHLVSEEVATQIVRFIAGTEDLAHAEVEPSLLSLVCRELNNTRLARGQTEITADLLAGSRETILSEFYERALADQPVGVRRFIEDELLTDSGYRESVAEERVKKAFAAAGAAPGALAFLVGRRLLRVEERLDVRRVELTHDVLCSVVKATREVRQERETKEAVERQLVATREKEAVTRRALFRARLVAGVCTVLLLMAAGTAVFAFSSLKRARQAEQNAVKAEQTAQQAAEAARAAEARTEAQRKLSDTARGQAEGLASFLLADFFDELEPTGRFDTIARLAERTVAYYSGLPEELRSPFTERRRALALVRQGWAVFSQGKYDAGEKMLNDAVAAFEKLRAEGDQEGSAMGLALSLAYQSQTYSAFRDPDAQLKTRQRAVELLRTSAAAANASARTKRSLAFALRLLGLIQPDNAAALALYEESRQVLAGTGALDYSDLSAASAHAVTTRYAASCLEALNRAAEAERYRKEALALVAEVLGRRPGDLLALYARSMLQLDQADAEFKQFNFDAALAMATAAEQTCVEYLRFNPGDPGLWQGVASTRSRVAGYLAQLGRINEAVEKFRAAANVAMEQRSDSEGIQNVPNAFASLAIWEARRGNQSAADKAFAEGVRIRATMDRERRFTEKNREVTRLYFIRDRQQQLMWARGDYARLIADAGDDVKATELLLQSPGITSAQKLLLQPRLPALRQSMASAHAMLGHHAEAEAILRELLPELKAEETTIAKSAQEAARRFWLALVLARQDRRAEALRIGAPAVAWYRDRAGKGDTTLDGKSALGASLYIQALAQLDDAEGRSARRALLDEAAQIMDSLSAEAKQLHDERIVIGWIAEERAKLGN